MNHNFIKAMTGVAAALLFAFAAVFSTSANGGTSIRIPAIDVDAPIVSIGIRTFPNGAVTWDTTQLTTEVGFLEGTAWFGQGGNIVLGGHSELANRVPTVFYNLDDLVAGDEIIVNVNGSDRRYIVSRVYTVLDSDLSIIQPSSSERLTIMTCDITSYVNGVYTRRIVVVANPA